MFVLLLGNIFKLQKDSLIPKFENPHNRNAVRTLNIQPSSFPTQGNFQKLLWSQRACYKSWLKETSGASGRAPVPRQTDLQPWVLSQRVTPQTRRPWAEAGLGQGTALPALPALRELLCSCRHRPGHFLGFSCTRTSVSPPRPADLRGDPVLVRRVGQLLGTHRGARGWRCGHEWCRHSSALGSNRRAGCCGLVLPHLQLGQSLKISRLRFYLNFELENEPCQSSFTGNKTQAQCFPAPSLPALTEKSNCRGKINIQETR